MADYPDSWIIGQHQVKPLHQEGAAGALRHGQHRQIGARLGISRQAAQQRWGAS